MHPLVRTAKSSLIDDAGPRPRQASYDFASGMWMGPNGPLSDGDDDIPRSKKADIETGEDQKGQ